MKPIPAVDDVVGTFTESASKCYDCNYDPTEQADGQQAGKLRGFQKCSLKSMDEENLVDRRPCRSETCFLRRDPNGRKFA